MRWIIETSMKLQYLVVTVAIALIAFGGLQLQSMPVDVYPEFNPPLVEIQTEALGLSSEEMESLITVPLEADLLNGVAWLDTMYSETVAGLSSILLVFEPGTDPIRARQMVQERLTQTFALPNVSKPPTMLQPLSASNRVMMIGMSTEEMSLIDMSVLAHWVIAPRLTGVPGVANVAVWGQREWQLQVQVDPVRLEENNVSLQQIITTTGEAMWVSPLSYLESSSPGTSGWIDTPNQRLGIQHILPISSAEDLAHIPVADSENLQLGDVADIIEDNQLLIGDALLHDGQGLMLVIEKFPNSNTLEVTKGVEEALDALQLGLTGINFDATVYRSANYVDQAVQNLSRLAIISGIALVIIIVLFYAGSWRMVLISILSIVASLVAAVTILYATGTTFNLMILSGLTVALAIIIHNAVVDVDMIVRRLSQYDDTSTNKSVITIIANAALEIREPLAYALIIIMLAVLPILYLGGLTGSFLKPIIVSFSLAVLASLFVALILTPALSYILYTGQRQSGRDNPIIAAIKSGYNNMLSPVISSVNLAVGISAVLVLLGVIALPMMNLTPMPDLRQTEIRIQWDSAPATGREAMIRVTRLAMEELELIPGVVNVGAHIGRAITGDQIGEINSGEIWVTLDPSANYNQTLEAIHEVVSGYPGMNESIGNYVPERLHEILTKPDHNFSVRIYGHEFDVLTDLAVELSEQMATVNGLTDIEVITVTEEPQIEIAVDLAAAERHHMKPGDIRRIATTLISGLTVGHLYEEQKVFEVVVWGKPEIRDSISDIENLLIDTPIGQVPLSELASIEIAPVPTVIQRDSVQRFIEVAANVNGRGLQAVTKDVEATFASLTFPLEYHAEVLTNGAQMSLLQSIFTAVAIVIAMYLLLQAAFESWYVAVIVIALLPVSLSGGVIAMLLTQRVVSIGGMLGLLLVFAIATRSITLFVIHIKRHIRAAGSDVEIFTSVMGAVNERMGAFITSIVAILAVLLVITLAGGIAGTEIIQPIAIVGIGGLITTTLVNLFLLPILYVGFAPDTRQVLTQ